MSEKVMQRKLYAGNQHMRFDEGVGVSARSGRSAQFYKWKLVLTCCAAALSGGVWAVNWHDAVAVRASSFGWNATNATKCLQAAFDSGAAKIVIDRQAGDWIIEPVFLRSNQEVVLEASVVVRALKGAYKSPNDCLFTVRGVSNVVLRGGIAADAQKRVPSVGTNLPTLRMERDDYADRKTYCFSEWRHTLCIVNSANVRVSDLALQLSGGDGIYVGGSSVDIDIRRVDCSDHYRQGLSVTGASNLYVADSRFAATKGTPPQCGIDFEPNKPSNRLSNCLVENCDLDDNAEHGFTLNLCCLNETSEPISVILRNCRMRGNAGHGCSLWVGNSVKGKPAKGTIRIEGCHMASNGVRAFTVNSVSRATASVMVKDSVLDARGSSWAGALVSNNRFSEDAANVTFENSRIFVDKEPAVEFSGSMGVGIESIGGTLVVERGGASAPFDFTALAAQNRPNPELRKAFGGSSVDYRTLRPVAPDAVVNKATPMCRGKFTFLQHLPKEGEYTLTFRAKTIGNRKLNCPVQMLDMMGTDLGMFSITAAVQTVTVKTAGRNLRRFEIDTCGNTVSVMSPYSGQGLLADAPLNLFRESCRLYFSVPMDAKMVHVSVTPEEPAAATLLNAVGEAVATMPSRTTASTLTAERDVGSAEIWSLEIKTVEDAMFRLGSSVFPVLAVDDTAGLVQTE